MNVEVKSRYNDVTIGKFKKSGFDIETLHAFVSPPSDPKLEGTEFRLTNLDSSRNRQGKGAVLEILGGEDYRNHEVRRGTREERGHSKSIHQRGKVG